MGNVAVAVFVDGADEAEHQREALGRALHDSVELRLFHLLLVPGAGSLEDAGPSRGILCYIFFVVLQRDARHLFVLENQLHRDILKRQELTLLFIPNFDSEFLSQLRNEVRC